MENRRIGIITIAVVVVAAVIVGAIMLTKNDGNDVNSGNHPTHSTKTSDSSVATNKVSIADFVFNPAKVTVKVGTTVTWTNNDSTPHTVTADSGTGPDSGSLAKGDTYQFTYKTAGTFTYHCNFHPDMQGTVVVTD